MPIVDSLLPEFDHEMANTRRVLERVPNDRLDWRPHSKSFAMGALATHVAQLPQWVVETMNRTELDLAPGGQPAPKTEEAKSAAELLERFDGHVAAARAALVKASDADLFVTWTLLQNGQKILAMPRAAVLRGFVMNHLIHHRAQLGLYLRLNDVPVPGLYGPSADETGF
jgi:uncharacterized damage-inducible protein DinB